MSSVFAWLPADGWQRLLCDALWQSTLIAGLGLVISQAAVRHSAARAWILQLTMLACVVVPLASLAARQGGWTLLAGRTEYTVASNDIFHREIADEREPAPAQASGLHPLGFQTPIVLTAASDAASGNAPPVSVFGAIAIAWIAASSLLTMRLALSLLATLRVLRRANPCDDVVLQAAAIASAHRVGLTEAPQLLVTGDIATPTVFAFGRPRLLIPRSDDGRGTCGVTADGLHIDWAAAFTHELAHVARGDGWSRLWAELTVILLPLQPLIWLARRRFHTACEEACDDWVVVTGTDAVDLAETLTAWCDMPRRPTAQFAIGMSSTKSRVLRLLALRGKPIANPGLGWRAAAATVAICFTAAVAIAQAPAKKAGNPDVVPAPTGAKREAKNSKKDNPPSEKNMITLPPYVIEPPDILLVTPVRLVPKVLTKVQPFDKVRIVVDGTPATQPINDTFSVTSAGEVVLGPNYGAVIIAGMTRREAQDAVRTALSGILQDPQVALIIDEGRRVSGIGGEHLVGPDGRVNLGIDGGVYVAGLTVAKATQAIEAQLAESFVDPKVAVDVFSYNSKVYYVVVEGGGLGDNIQRFPITGNETVLDAISNIKGLSRLSSRKIWVSRPGPDGEKVLAVKWEEVITGRGTTTNYQILPGDRVFIAADKDAVQRELRDQKNTPPRTPEPF